MTGKKIRKIRLDTISIIFIVFIAAVYFMPSQAEMAGPDLATCTNGLPLFAPVADPSNPDKSAQCASQCTANGYGTPLWNKDGYQIPDGRIAHCCCKDKIVAVPAGQPPAACLPGSTDLCNPLGSGFNDPKEIPTLIGNVIKGLFGIIGTIALIMFIFGGFLWMTAFGEEGKIKKGWDAMIWAGMGLAVIFGSYIAVDFILKAILGS